NFENIIYEVDDIFFWKKRQMLKKNATFECEILSIGYCFPNDNTVSLVQKIYKKDIYERLKIIIKLELKVINDYESVSEDNIVNIICFENNLPDFLINKTTYENNLAFYQKHVEDNIDYNFIWFDIVMSDGVFKSKLLKVIL